MFFRVLIISGLFLFWLIREVNADIVYLKNGRSIEGLLKEEDEQGIELDVGFGTIKFSKNQIARIEKSSTDESLALKQQWQRHKLELEEERLKRELAPKQIEVYPEHGHIMVNAVLNRRVAVSLLLDTGASLVVLPNNIAKKLGINTNEKEARVELQLADGRKVNASYVLLETIKVQDVEAKNVDAAVLLDDVSEIGFKDGLLGMSFLNRFNFKVDQKSKRLILERVE